MTAWDIIFPCWRAAGTTAAVLSIPGTLELAFLTVGGLLPVRRKAVSGDAAPWRIAVVIPAHNEETGITACVHSLQRCAAPGTKVDIIVVADNCTDQTAGAATAAGARVLVRNNLERRGKGYALDHAFGILLHEDIDAFLVVDADTRVAEAFLSETVMLLRSGADAVQCRYLAGNPTASMRTRLMSVALRAFNVLRPQGRERWGLSCHLYGNGFGMRRETLVAAPYSAASVVEDLEYHLLLVKSGRRVRFVNETAVYGEMPESGRGVATQRSRWEGGRLRMLREKAPALAVEVLKGRFSLLEPLLDLLLLPLALHVALLLVAASTPWTPAAVAGIAGLTIVLIHLLAAIFATGGGLRDLSVLCVAPFYIAWKIALIPRLIKNSLSGAAWVRTERATEKKAS